MNRLSKPFQISDKPFGSVLLSGCLVLLLVTDASAQRIRIPHHQDKPPGPALSPQEAIAKMKVPDGFSVELVVSEPDLVNPVGMTFDERGRIWVTESLEYPRKRPGPGKDRVKILEDTDGDGRIDKTQVFLDGLNIPSGIAVGHGGVWVANAPDILFVRDTNNDGVADEKQVVVTGFGRSDTHELPNSLTWGPDGWLYGLNGVFNHSHVRYPSDSPHHRPDHPGFRFTCAMFRIHPTTREFQLFAEGTSNPWGIAWDAQGSAFISACVIDHLWHITETGYYHRQGGPYPPFTWKLGSIVKHKHQKAAYCGIEYFDSAAYPEPYRGHLYMGNIHGNCINVDSLKRSGATYDAAARPDFLTANDVWFMPVAQKTGPDGCLYVLDWYDRYHCYQDANRDPKGIDRLRGRIYRIRYQQTPRVAGFDFQAQTSAALVEKLRDPNVYTRRIAQRILQERCDKSVATALERIVWDRQTAQKTRLHALWSMMGQDLPEPFHKMLAKHFDPLVRAWAVRAAGNQGRDIGGIVAKAIGDSEPTVRLQAAISSAKINKQAGVSDLLQVADRSGADRLIPHIVWQNLYPHLDQPDSFLAAIRKDDLARSSAMQPILSRSFDRLLSSRSGAVANAVGLLEQLIEAGPSAEASAAECLAVLARRVQSGEIKAANLESLKRALEPILSTLTGKTSQPARKAALLATSWKDPTALQAVRTMLADRSGNPSERIQALNALVAAEAPNIATTIAELLARSSESVRFRGELITSLGRMRDREIAKVLLDRYPEFEPELKPRVIELLTQRTSWSKQLMERISPKNIPAEALNLNQVRRLLALGDRELTTLVNQNWGTVRTGRDPNREKRIAAMKKFLLSNEGDPFAGAAVFKKVCAQCHKMYGKGEEVGPDITLNGRNSFDQLLSNVLDPSLVIGAAYRSYTVATADGRVLTGLLVEETPERISLKVQGGKTERISRSDIEVFKQNQISLMPEDLEKQLKPGEIADLFAYLALDRPPEDPEARRLPGSTRRRN